MKNNTKNKEEINNKNLKQYVYVLDIDGNPLDPTHKLGKVRHLLKTGKAKVKYVNPFFTIQLTYKTTTYTKSTTLKVDSGYKYIGVSVVTNTKEVLAINAKLLDGIKERITDRRKYRRTRRTRLRYRKPRFNNRKASKPKDWIAPTLQHKYDSHLKLINLIKVILPITDTIVEVGNFDMQKLKNPNIDGVEYQQGPMKDFWNVREYVLHRAGHKCENPNCKNKDKNPILEVHHHKYWTGKIENNPNDLVILCNKCHTPRNHQKGGFLWGWKPNISKTFKEATFMNIIRWRIVNKLNCRYSYGYITKFNRIEAKLKKEHYNDAFCIETVGTQERCVPVELQWVRRNNRSLSKFYDAKYIDSRTGEKVSGKDLFSGRTTRNKTKSSENLHKYRKEKVSKGRVSIRIGRSKYQPKDIVLYKGKKFTVVGSQNKGAYVRVMELPKPIKTNDICILYYAKKFTKISLIYFCKYI